MKQLFFGKGGVGIFCSSKSKTMSNAQRIRIDAYKPLAPYLSPDN